MVENKGLVMVGLFFFLIDSLRNLNPPFQAEEAHGRGPPSGQHGDYLKVPGIGYMPLDCLCLRWWL